MNPTVCVPNPLQRSKSLSSADILTRGIASLGLGLNAEDIGTFAPEITAVINKANEDPNQLTARCLMELATHCMNRAIEGRRLVMVFSTIIFKISKFIVFQLRASYFPFMHLDNFKGKERDIFRSPIEHLSPMVPRTRKSTWLNT